MPARKSRLSANSRTHSTTSLHKAEARLGGLTTIHKDDRKANPRDALHKVKKHSSSSSALAAKRTASKTSVHRASTTRLYSNEKQQHTKQDKPSDKQEDEGWVSSESAAGTPIRPDDDDDDDDDDDELDDDEILVLQTQRAQRNAREAERLKAVRTALEAELRAKQMEGAEDRSPPASESPKKHTNYSPARPSPPPIQSPLAAPKSASPEDPSPSESRLTRQPDPVPTLAPVIQQPIADHTKHTFPTQASPSPPAPVPSHRNKPRHSDPIPHDYAQANGTNHTTQIDPDGQANKRANDPSVRTTDSSPRPPARRSHTHAARPPVITSGHAPGASRTQTLAAASRPHPLIRAPSILTKTTPILAPLTAPPYLSAHSAQAQMSSSPPPQTPSTTSARSSPPHTRQPSLSSSTHTLPILTVSPTAALATSASSLPHSPQTRALSIHSSPTASFKPNLERERERTVSAVSSTAALHVLAHNHPAARKSATSRNVQASTFPPEPADTYGGGMYGGGPGAGVYTSYGGGIPGAFSTAGVTGAVGGMYGGKSGPTHALLPAPYMATHSSIGRWYAPARDAIGRVVRGRAGV